MSPSAVKALKIADMGLVAGPCWLDTRERTSKSTDEIIPGFAEVSTSWLSTDERAALNKDVTLTPTAAEVMRGVSTISSKELDPGERWLLPSKTRPIAMVDRTSRFCGDSVSVTGTLDLATGAALPVLGT